MTKLFTKTGDNGTTSLANGIRVQKTDIRIETNGQIDELNAVLGLVKGQAIKPLSTEIDNIQHDLEDIMSAVAGQDICTTRLEQATIHFEQKMSEHEYAFKFVTPGSTMLNALLHLARTKARTCERQLWEANAIMPLHPSITTYMNRLSDYLFYMSIGT